MTKTITNPEIAKGLAKTHSGNDVPTIVDHSKLISIKTIQNYPSTTGTLEQGILTQR